MKKSEISEIAYDLIASNKIQEVFDLLLNYARKDKDVNEYLNELILLSSRYNQLKKQSLLSLVTYAEETLETNKIIHALLGIVKRLDEKTDKIEIKGDDNIVIQGISGSTVNVQGNFKIEEKISKVPTKKIKELINGQSKIKILFVASNPSDNARLRLDIEVRDIKQELLISGNIDKFELITVLAARVHDLETSLLKHSPNFIHFSGHGNEEGIALSDNDDNTQIVPSKPLANLFKLFSNDIACVFLNSCYSESQARLIKRFIPNVIGMKESVLDKTAIEFAKAFYRALGSGREISFAFEFAKISIDLNDIGGSDIPVML